MARNSGIEWTDHTWNPWYGCLKVSTGCVNCYMYREFQRFGLKNPNVCRRSKTTFNDPMKWEGPATVFACSWSDWFHGQADAWRDEAWEIIRRTPTLTYLLLTKRPEMAVKRLPHDWGQGWQNVWIGTSIEDQASARARLRRLAEIPAQHRFLSVEPLIAPVDLSTAATAVDLRQFVQWIICGGETGPRARTCDLQWIRTVRDTAVAAAIPFFVKSHGGHDGNGRALDGITWSEFPEDLCRRAGGRCY